MIIRPGSLIGYLQAHHPDIHTEVMERLASSPICGDTFQSIYGMARQYVEEDWQIKLVTITAALLYSSPETLYSEMPIRDGVAKTLGIVLHVSQQAVSKKLEQSRHYYTHVSWCREAVDKIVKEVRGE